jgi:peptide/nickel transport system permease protein
MLKYLTRRILQMVPVLLLITIIVFCFVNLSGDPTAMLLPSEATPDDRDAMREAMGLNRPLYIQYGIFLNDLLHGNFGRSYQYRLPAIRVVSERIPASLELAGVSLLMAVTIGVTMGVLSAMAKGTSFDLLVNGFAALGRAMPNFWMGIMLILVFGVMLRILPVSGHGGWRFVILPAVSLAIQNSSKIIPLVRSSMLEIMHQDYIRTARSKGLRERIVVFKHAFKNALVPVVTIMALQIPDLIGGSLVTETVFAWPGLGQLVIQAVNTHDMRIIQTCVIFISLITMAASLLADIVYCLIDPRIKY